MKAYDDNMQMRDNTKRVITHKPHKIWAWGKHHEIENEVRDMMNIKGDHNMLMSYTPPRLSTVS